MSNFRNKLLILLSLVISAASLSCMEKDPFFGNTMIPPHQLMESTIDSSIGINTYVTKLDSVPMSNFSYNMILGRYVEPIAGEINGSFITNFAPTGFKTDAYFGYKDVKMDSITLNTYFTYSLGDKKTPLKVEIFLIEGYNFLHDSTYYSNFRVEKYVNLNAPLATLSVDSTGIFIARLPKSFAEKLYDPAHDSTNIYYSDRKFHKHFNGLYFRANTSAPNGSLYTLSMSQVNMFLYYSNKDDAAKPDSVYTQQLYAHLENAYGNLTPYNSVIQLVKNDYTKADPSKGGVDYRIIGDTIHPTEKCFVSGPSGLMTRVEIIEKDFNALLERVKAKGYSTIAIHKAELQWQKVDKTWQSLDDSYPGLGIYRDMIKGKFIADYDILYATSMGTQTTLGGSINRSTGIYSMDVTRYVQGLVSSSNKKYFVTQMGPLFDNIRTYTRTSTWGALSPTVASKPFLILTYTMIK